MEKGFNTMVKLSSILSFIFAAGIATESFAFQSSSGGVRTLSDSECYLVAPDLGNSAVQEVIQAARFFSEPEVQSQLDVPGFSTIIAEIPSLDQKSIAVLANVYLSKLESEYNKASLNPGTMDQLKRLNARKATVMVASHDIQSCYTSDSGIGCWAVELNSLKARFGVQVVGSCHSN
jgi:hypothetical protein